MQYTQRKTKSFKYFLQVCAAANNEVHGTFSLLVGSLLSIREKLRFNTTWMGT